MGNFLLGFKALFRTWGDAKFAGSVHDLLEGKAAPEPALPAPVAVEAEPSPPPPKELTQRNDALSLLSLLQREARLVDFLKEPIDTYSDADVGAAVRSLHKDCAAALERLFALEPLSSQPEGSTIEVPAGFDPAQYRFVGNIPARPPFRGKVAHPGWKAKRCEVPVWKGTEESALVLSPTEVEF
jgi:hypothetical protein